MPREPPAEHVRGRPWEKVTAPAADDAAGVFISNESETGYREIIRSLKERVQTRFRRGEERPFRHRREFQRLDHIARDLQVIREILRVRRMFERRLILTVLRHILRREKSKKRIPIRIQFP
jgi:hypothetical protein